MKAVKAVHILTGAFGLAALASTAANPQAPSVPALVATAGSACFAALVRFTGLVVPRAEAVVDFHMPGYEISDIFVDEGDSVSAGQVLARLKRLASAPTATGAAAAAGATGPAPATSLALTAPAAGVISAANAKIGDVAAAVPLPPPLGPPPLFRIIVANALEVEADVPSIHLAKLKAGQPARLRLENGADLRGRVRTIAPEIDPRTQFGKVRLVVDPDAATRAGMFARGTIEASHSCGVSVPLTAVLYSSQGTTVQIVRDNVVETRQVSIGFSSETDIEVREGVRQGELIIANAGTSLHDGDRIRPIFDASLTQ